jgi:hypothetical protein
LYLELPEGLVMADGTSAALRPVARGLALVFAGLALLMLTGSAYLMVRSFVLTAQQRADENAEQDAVLAVPTPVGPIMPAPVRQAFAAAALVFTLLHLLGQLMCLSVPSEAGARGPLFVAVLLNLLAEAAATLELVSPWIGLEPDLGLPWLNVWLLTGLLSVLALLAFLGFLRRLSVYLGDGSGQSDSETLLFYWVVCIVLYLLLDGLRWCMVNVIGASHFSELFNRSDFDALLVLVGILLVTVGLLLVGLITLVKFFNLLTHLRRTIQERIAREKAALRPDQPGLRPS